MRPALLLIDLQNDFLSSSSLVPARGSVVDRAARLLNHCRAVALPVIHIWTTADHQRRMPHWEKTGKLICRAGTNGHSPPEALLPLDSETIIHKTFFSGFSNDQLAPLLRSLKVDTLLIAGVHLHGCIRSTVLDAYQQGYACLVAEDAVASDDPLHAALTRRYLESRAATFNSVQDLCSIISNEVKTAGCGANGNDAREIVHFSPRQSNWLLWRLPTSSGQEIEAGISMAKESSRRWRSVNAGDRLALLARVADMVESQSDVLSRQIALEVGKPISYARQEVARSVRLLRGLSSHVCDGVERQCGKDVGVRYRPVGTVALITPWNNPMAIPIGKIGPALLYGNAVVWKPAPVASNIAIKMMELFRSAQMPEGLINLVLGYRSAALQVMGHHDIDAVSLSGSLAAGYSAQDMCARRHVPLQAELGGNNASIIWHDCDLEDAAVKVAESAFGFSGQRCTANRRAIVSAACYAQFVKLLEQATARLVWNDPLDERTHVGPVISQAKRDELRSLVARAEKRAQFVVSPHRPDDELMAAGAYFPATIIGCDDPQAEIVQEESFGPILVVQRAENWEQAIELCNGVKQGLVASVFSHSKAVQSAFLEEAQCGILKINSGTANAAAEAPFCGWKASGIGPPEHGAANREFYTRTQAIYR
ncbi:MAG TPA: aldehyde dehydrogenase family protein [Candidatus Obscuribacterales bacterium]